jgi:gliding motility-associated-like protein
MTNPEIEDIEDYQLENCNEEWPEFLTTNWTDNCAAGGEIDSDEGVADGESEDGCIQYRLYTFTITDHCDNTDTETTRVSRAYDMTNPEIEDIVDYQLENCNEEWPEFLTTTWTDNCATGGEIDSDEGVVDDSISDETFQFKLYTFIITDECGNSDTETTLVKREVGGIIQGEEIELCRDYGDFDLYFLLPDGYIPGGSWSLNLSPDDFSLDISDQGIIYVTEDLLFGDYVFHYNQGSDECFSIIEVKVYLLEAQPPCVGNCSPSAPDTALTPNGDGVNDAFFGGYGSDARSLGCTMHLRIFDRWGHKIFEDKDYKNDWSGSVHSNAVGSKGTITTGTYFYIITYSDSQSTETINGYIYVATE